MAQRRQSPHAQIFLFWIGLPAWYELSSHAKVLLVEYSASYHPDKPNLFNASDRYVAARLGCSRATAAKVIAELVEKGWLRIERPGGFRGHPNARGRVVSLTTRPTETHPTPTCEFKLWGRTNPDGSKKSRKRPPAKPLEIHPPVE